MFFSIRLFLGGVNALCMGVWQRVAMDSLKIHLGQPCPTLQRPAGRPPLKQSGQPAAVFYPFVVCLVRSSLQFHWADRFTVRLVSDQIMGLSAIVWINKPYSPAFCPSISPCPTPLFLFSLRQTSLWTYLPNKNTKMT
jgi:hypothetical protein